MEDDPPELMNLPSPKRRRLQPTSVSNQVQQAQSIRDQNIALASAIDQIFTRLDDLEFKMQSKLTKVCEALTEDLQKRSGQQLNDELEYVRQYTRHSLGVVPRQHFKKLQKISAMILTHCPASFLLVEIWQNSNKDQTWPQNCDNI